MAIKVNENGKIIFRHPHVKDGKYGKVICLAVAKLSGEKQGKIKDGLELLLELKPTSRSEVKGEIDEVAEDAYFDPMGLENQDDRPDWTPEQEAKAADGTYAWIEIERELAAEQAAKDARRIAQLESQLQGVVKATGSLTAVQKKLTLEDCFEHFKKHTQCKSIEARDNLLRQVGAVLKLMGMDTLHAAVTKGMIDKAVEGSDFSETEKTVMLKNAKRFFKELSYPLASDGLGLINPAIAIKIQPAKKKDVILLDPGSVLKNEKLPLYWKVLVACIGYGSFRLAEAASLEWDRIKDGIIKVRATTIYPELKSAMSERDIRPFDDLFPWLDKLKAERGGEGLLFPRINARRKRGKKAKTIQAATWFRIYKGKPRAMDLSGALADALNKARAEGDPKFEEPARSLRRFWETSMRERGLGHLIEAMGGHSDEVGLNHYTRFESIVKSAKVGRL